jgi:hypothetical protein
MKLRKVFTVKKESWVRKVLKAFYF